MVTQGVNLYCIVSQICLCCIHIHKQLKQIVILDINKVNKEKLAASIPISILSLGSSHVNL